MSKGHDIARGWAVSGKPPLWVAVCLYALGTADQSGRAHLRPGQLREAVAPRASASVVSQAIRTAVRHGLLHDSSSASCLRLAVPKARRA
ncbi:MAG: hypothetical protein QM621_14895 [Aeromicrobium sp.]|uniref:hypothetical protein n=1 Tax=Aeromicrobium sp. TaxID=1871063 RepID=UPI0039E469C9